MDGVTGEAEPAVSPVRATIFAHRPAHRWWFFPDLRADEALLFKRTIAFFH